MTALHRVLGHRTAREIGLVLMIKIVALVLLYLLFFAAAAPLSEVDVGAHLLGGAP